jgi:hypothetical protein
LEVGPSVGVPLRSDVVDPVGTKLVLLCRLNLVDPAVWIWILTSLDADQSFTKHSGGWACLASSDMKLPAVEFYRADAGYDSGGAAGECLFQLAARGIRFQFFE